MVPVAIFRLMVWFERMPTTWVPLLGASTTVLAPAGAVIGPLQAPPLTVIAAPPLSENWKGSPAIPLDADLQISIVPGAGACGLAGAWLWAQACAGTMNTLNTKTISDGTNHSGVRCRVLPTCCTFGPPG